MKIFLTGGSGDLGQLLCNEFIKRGDTPTNFDIMEPEFFKNNFIQGSILDRKALEESIKGNDMFIHIAALHGIHEASGKHDAYDFWDINVTGTLNVFEAAARAKIKNALLISSTSVRHVSGLYGHSKIMSEEVARLYSVRHSMNVIILRPRGFIPAWNKQVYKNFLDWAAWFYTGAVHIDDVLSSVLQSISLMEHTHNGFFETFTLDGKYDYTPDDLDAWDTEGKGSTFTRYYGKKNSELFENHGIDISRKPTIYNIEREKKELGYIPKYSLQNFFEEFEQYGSAGPAHPLRVKQ